MRRSEERIPTTHTGSLPRPAELIRLHMRRARGESVDMAELDRPKAIVVWAKLRALADGAEIASARLGPG
jgi:5-methyltetrahydropteroyltriglutamate--homocysteine methyltransferase